MFSTLKTMRSRMSRPSAPHCRGGASSLLRVSAAGSERSVFGALELGLSLRKAPAMRTPAAADTSKVAFGEQHLWSSATFAGRALWQDTCVAFD